MKLSELILAVGDDNVKVQVLDSCFTNADYHHKKGTTITFGTDQKLTADGTGSFGLVVWLPREKVQELLNGDSGGGL